MTRRLGLGAEVDSNEERRALSRRKGYVLPEGRAGPSPTLQFRVEPRLLAEVRDLAATWGGDRSASEVARELVIRGLLAVRHEEALAVREASDSEDDALHVAFSVKGPARKALEARARLGRASVNRWAMETVVAGLGIEPETSAERNDPRRKAERAPPEPRTEVSETTRKMDRAMRELIEQEERDSVDRSRES